MGVYVTHHRKLITAPSHPGHPFEVTLQVQQLTFFGGVTIPGAYHSSIRVANLVSNEITTYEAINQAPAGESGFICAIPGKCTLTPVASERGTYTWPTRTLWTWHRGAPTHALAAAIATAVDQVNQSRCIATMPYNAFGGCNSNSYTYDILRRAGISPQTLRVIRLRAAVTFRPLVGWGVTIPW